MADEGEVDDRQGKVIVPAYLEDWNEKFIAAKESDKLVVIGFTAAWCASCQTFAPTFVKFAEMFPNVVFFSVDVNDFKSVAEEFDVPSILPTFFFLLRGIYVDKVFGAATKELQLKLEKYSEA